MPRESRSTGSSKCWPSKPQIDLKVGRGQNFSNSSGMLRVKWESLNKNGALLQNLADFALNYVNV